MNEKIIYQDLDEVLHEIHSVLLIELNTDEYEIVCERGSHHKDAIEQADIALKNRGWCVDEKIVPKELHDGWHYRLKRYGQSGWGLL